MNAPGRGGVAEPLTVTRLQELIGAGEVETVLCVLPDLHGRLMGKRITADYFLEDTLAGGEGLHASIYLFVVDMDMEPLPGFDITSWETGYQDFRMVPDLTTLRLIPWQAKTAMVICDAYAEEGDEPVEVAPRQILRRQIERARAAGYSFKFGSELEFFMFRDSYEQAWQRRYESLEPSANYRADYHMLQTAKVEEIIGQIRAGMNGARVPVFASKGEWGLGQHEINLRYADPLEMADRHSIYKNGAKEIAAQSGLSITFMAKWAIEEIGSSFHIHSSLWDAEGVTPLLWDAAAPHHLSQTARHYLGGILAGAREMTYLFAPNVNSYKRFQPASFAPTTIAWGHDNRTCGFRLVGERGSLRLENRIPGADANPYLAFAATIASALHGLEHELEPPPICERNAYEAPETGLVPGTLLEAIELFAASRLACDAFGESVVKHLVNVARQELEIFNHQTITDWERRRYFERA